MKCLVENFDRKELFWQYHNRCNPFIFVTTKIDITNIYNNYKNYYPTIAYFISEAVNKVDNFKYRFINGKVYKYDYIRPAFTELGSDKKIGFFGCNANITYQDYIEDYKIKKEKFMKTGENELNEEENEFWVSCTPWFSFTSLVPPFDKEITIPQFIWDKFDVVDGHCYVNLLIMAHHGFVDGYHISLFLKELNDIINNIEGEKNDKKVS